jgi:hypothetical protein
MYMYYDVKGCQGLSLAGIEIRVAMEAAHQNLTYRLHLMSIECRYTQYDNGLVVGVFLEGTSYHKRLFLWIESVKKRKR